ncbi:DUF2635 domain-containing protein [Cupriavidus oxalaticus]|uniref:DUF2635 domain-containing protein n=1 Tax=Cupriavidus oxalaticus TaxID=96344 RepID=A0A4P7LJ19_9BURK|nr:DUF2635 domain-containing protein [Cupriavidus oxalaticus]QBY56150.1 DUF2635 domain-containing protein [Cupriavidus oxalaticus]
MNTDRKTVHVTPAAGRVVPDPDYGDTLPASGRTVVRSPYWARRIQDNDVIVDAAQPADGAPVKTAKGAK